MDRRRRTRTSCSQPPTRVTSRSPSRESGRSVSGSCSRFLSRGGLSPQLGPPGIPYPFQPSVQAIGLDRFVVPPFSQSKPLQWNKLGTCFVPVGRRLRSCLYVAVIP